MKRIKLFAPSKILYTYWYRFIKTDKCDYFLTNQFHKKIEDDSATMFFLAKRTTKTILHFSLDSLNVTE